MPKLPRRQVSEDSELPVSRLFVQNSNLKNETTKNDSSCASLNSFANDDDNDDDNDNDNDGNYRADEIIPLFKEKDTHFDTSCPKLPQRRTSFEDDNDMLPSQTTKTTTTLTRVEAADGKLTNKDYCHSSSSSSAVAVAAAAAAAYMPNIPQQQVSKEIFPSDLDLNAEPKIMLVSIQKVLEERAASKKEKNTEVVTENSHTFSSSVVTKRGDELQAFRARFEQESKTWKKKLESVAGLKTISTHRQTGNKEVTTDSSINITEQRTALKMALSDLQADLEALSTASSGGGSGGGANARFADWEVPSIVPPSEMALLHSELTKCAILLETTRNELLPKGKFTFHRYRLLKSQQAQFGTKQIHSDLQQQQQQQQQQPNGRNGTDKTILSNPDKMQLVRDRKSPLEDLEHCTVEVAETGNVSITAMKASSSECNNKQSLSVSGESSLVIRNIRDCSITMYVFCQFTLCC